MKQFPFMIPSSSSLTEFQDHLSVVDGRYDENIHWFTSNERYIGGGANGRCYIGIDKETGKTFALKRVSTASI